MDWSDIDLRPDHRKLRQFAVLVTGIALVFAAVALRRHGTLLTMWSVAAVYGAISVARPRLAHPLYVGLTVATFPIGWLVSRLVLGIVFYVVITPVALTQRLVRRDALNLRDTEEASYWEKTETPRDPASYLRQF